MLDNVLRILLPTLSLECLLHHCFHLWCSCADTFLHPVLYLLSSNIKDTCFDRLHSFMCCILYIHNHDYDLQSLGHRLSFWFHSSAQSIQHADMVQSENFPMDYIRCLYTLKEMQYVKPSNMHDNIPRLYLLTRVKCHNEDHDDERRVNETLV